MIRRQLDGIKTFDLHLRKVGGRRTNRVDPRHISIRSPKFDTSVGDFELSNVFG